MSGRPEWMPSDDAIRACSAVDHVESANMKLYVVTATGALLRKTGIRSQIAVLEELPVAFVEVGGKSRLCADHLLWVKNKIAALRKELEE